MTDPKTQPRDPKTGQPLPDPRNPSSPAVGVPVPTVAPAAPVTQAPSAGQEDARQDQNQKGSSK